MYRSHLCVSLILTLLILPALPARGESPVKVLVSTGRLQHSYFDQTVVLVTRHGANREHIGVILNQSLHITMSEFLGLDDDHPFGELGVYNGGPVAQQVLVGLVACDTPLPDSLEIADGLYLTPNLQVVADKWDDLEIDDIRIFRGYAAWLPGQMENEIKLGAWKSEFVKIDDLFPDDTSGLWRKLHGRPAPIIAQATIRP